MIVDYINVALMLLAGATSLRVRPGSAAGLLASAWAFNFGFGWRSAFGRLELLEAGAARVNNEAAFVFPIVADALAVVAITLVWALTLAFRQAVRSRR